MHTHTNTHLCPHTPRPPSPAQGERRSMAQAIYIVTAAVDRYKELCEGKYSSEAAINERIVHDATA